MKAVGLWKMYWVNLRNFHFFLSFVLDCYRWWLSTSLILPNWMAMEKMGAVGAKSKGMRAEVRTWWRFLKRIQLGSRRWRWVSIFLKKRWRISSVLACGSCLPTFVRPFLLRFAFQASVGLGNADSKDWSTNSLFSFGTQVSWWRRWDFAPDSTIIIILKFLVSRESKWRSSDGGPPSWSPP